MKEIDSEKLKEIQEELKWVKMREETTAMERLTSKGIFGFLVPAGCILTTGVLASGIYHMFKRDSRKQQMLMRYRVAAQGVTLALAVAGLFVAKYSS